MEKRFLVLGIAAVMGFFSVVDLLFNQKGRTANA
jgi:hypothetical protein